MKLLIAAILSVSTLANATGSHNNGLTANNFSESIATQHQSQTNASSASNAIKFEDKLQLPNVPNLSSGSSNTTAGDYKFKQRQVSTLLGGITNIDMELDIIGFLKYYGAIVDAETKATFNIAACIESEKWRILRKQQGLDCPK